MPANTGLSIEELGMIVMGFITGFLGVRYMFDSNVDFLVSGMLVFTSLLLIINFFYQQKISNS